MHEVHVLTDLTILFGLALGVVLLCHRLNLPTIVGLLLTGTTLGPYGFRFVSDAATVSTLAEIGIILLLFGIGLEFSLERLSTIRTVILAGGSIQFLSTAAVVTSLSYTLGTNVESSLLYGALAGLSSTAIVMKLIQQKALLETPHGLNSLGILIYQDIMIVPLLILVPLLGGNTPNFTREFLLRSGLGVVAVGLILLLSRWAIPRLLRFVVELEDREIFVFTLVSLILGICWLTARAGLSLSLGAFLSGLIISESEHSHDVLENVIPFRDVFAGLFFVSIGMLLDPLILIDRPVIILALTWGVLLLKTVTGGLAIYSLGYPVSVALLVGLSINQIGEFSLILAKVGLGYGLLDPGDYQLFLAVTLMTMIVTPFEFQLFDGLENFIQQKSETPTRLSRYETLSDHLIVVGFGPVGESAVQTMENLDRPYVIVEMNPLTVETQRRANRPVLYGDASQDSVLQEAGIERARALLVSTGLAPSSLNVTKRARELNPDLLLLVRSPFDSAEEDLREAGADEIISDERLVSASVRKRINHLFS